MARAMSRACAGRIVGVLAVALLGAGCATVQPYERGRLASPAMRAGDESEMARQYGAKIVESKTAGGLAGTAPGGGCGCTQ